jgi:hypothetical protein
MRNFIPIVLAAALAGCAAVPPPPAATIDPRAQARLAELIGGKVAGPPQACLPRLSRQDMIAIDDNTIVYRESSARVWVMRPQGPCNMLSAGPYALVTRSTSTQLCRGEIGEVVHTTTGASVGSCAFGEFVPYTRPSL